MMNGLQNLKKQLRPLVKGLPIIALVFIAFLFGAKKLVDYSPNMYQATAKIQLDNQKYGYSGNKLYKNFDVFTSENKVETEAEVLKSPLIISKALSSVKGMMMSIYRVGKFKSTLLYTDAPFTIEYDSGFVSDRNFSFELKISNKSHLSITFANQSKVNGSLGEPFFIDGRSIKISRNLQVFNKRGLDIDDTYKITLWNNDKLVNHISSNLNVVPVDKEVSVLRVVYKDEHPQLVADFTNAICEAYIKDHVSSKAEAANKTENFIEQKISEVRLKLKAAEQDLERYKKDHDVVNTTQETETGLRHISKLEIQKINLDMQVEAIRELQQYIEKGDYFNETAINFGFGDLLLTELVKKLKLWQDERRDLITKYTDSHEKVIAANDKIEEIKGYIKEAIAQNLKDIVIRQKDIEVELEEASHMFDDLPTRERDLNILDREFRLLEDVYNFLSQKKIEASITSSSNISFHRIIQPAIPPSSPISPNKVLITFVGGLLGLIIGIFFVYFRSYSLAKVASRDDIERHTGMPICGVVRQNNQLTDATQLVKRLLIKKQIQPGSIITVCSTMASEGKTYVANQFVQALSSLDYTAFKVDSNNLGFDNETLNKLQENYDFLLVDTSSTSMDISSIEWMCKSTLCMYVVRANHTKMAHMQQPKLIADEYGLTNIEIVLNGAPKTSNYSGHYQASVFKSVNLSLGGKLSNMFKRIFAR